MKNLIKFLKNLIPKDLPKPMGRWNNEYCDIKTTQKIDLSNEDHCGPCGQYALSKLDLNINKDKNSDYVVNDTKNNK
jgi:hypothetical protein